MSDLKIEQFMFSIVMDKIFYISWNSSGFLTDTWGPDCQEPTQLNILCLPWFHIYFSNSEFHFSKQHKRRLYTWTSPDGQHQNQIDYILSGQRWRYSIQSAKTRPGADCGSDHELLIAKFKLKLKKVEKTTRPFRYDLNQIPYDYTVESGKQTQGIRSNRQSAWRTMDWSSWHWTGGRDQDRPQGKEIQKGKTVVWGGLTNSCK